MHGDVLKTECIGEMRGILLASLPTDLACSSSSIPIMAQLWVMAAFVFEVQRDQIFDLLIDFISYTPAFAVGSSIACCTANPFSTF